MAQFYAEIQGNRGVASRIGGRDSGIWGHIRGWNVGICVVGHVNEETGWDEFYVYKTSGSSGSGIREVIAIVSEGGEIRYPALQQISV